jgi:transcriptional regulator with XRE-family HTH domain
MDIIDALREERQKQNLLQKDLGERCGLSRSYVARIENKMTDTGLSNVVKMADALGYELVLKKKKR